MLLSLQRFSSFYQFSMWCNLIRAPLTMNSHCWESIMKYQVIVISSTKESHLIRRWMESSVAMILMIGKIYQRKEGWIGFNDAIMWCKMILFNVTINLFNGTREWSSSLDVFFCKYFSFDFIRLADLFKPLSYHHRYEELFAILSCFSSSGRIPFHQDTFKRRWWNMKLSQRGLKERNQIKLLLCLLKREEKRIKLSNSCIK